MTSARGQLALVGCLLFLCGGSVRAGDDLRVGASLVDITSPAGYRMCGYFNERLNTGLHDPLTARVLYLEQGDQRAALVICDLCFIDVGITQRVRRGLAERMNFAQTSVVIAATHSHTGPEYAGPLRDYFHQQAIARDGADRLEAVDYPAELAAKIVDAVVAASSRAQPARLAIALGDGSGLSFNRRFHMQDGSVVFNPGKLNPQIVRTAGPVDPDVDVLVARSAATHRPLACLTVFALHLDTVGGTDYSADFPFFLHTQLEKHFGQPCMSLFANGTCGDINHIDVSHDRPQRGFDEAQRIGDELARRVMAALPEARPLAAPSFAARIQTVNVPLQEYAQEAITSARRNMDLVGTSSLGFLEQVEAVKIVSLASRPKRSQPMEVSVMRLDDSTAIVGLPGEVFVDLGLAVKQRSPFANTAVIELIGDYHYIPTRKAFAEGSYETVNSIIAPGGGEMLVATAVSMLKDLAPKGR